MVCARMAHANHLDLAELRAQVNARLEAFFAEKTREVQQLAPESLELTRAIASLTMRGGKRLRAAVVWAGQAVGPKGDQASEQTVSPHASASLLDVAASLELLQSYFLIHDDWMDQDNTRRGAPTVHCELSAQHRGDTHLGASVAVLAGDLASAYALECLWRADYSPVSRERSLGVFLSMQKEVFVGQHLDLIASHDVALMHRLKTASYTVRGPVQLGALLADADDAQLQALETFANPIGVAFQLRDDLLGTFGDESATGKSAGNDLRAGKNTALVEGARKQMDATTWERFAQIWGHADASDASIAEARGLLESCGVRAAVEERLKQLTAEACRAAEEGPWSEFATRQLKNVAALMVERSL